MTKAPRNKTPKVKILGDDKSQGSEVQLPSIKKLEKCNHQAFSQQYPILVHLQNY
jgi:hypothetical protein